MMTPSLPARLHAGKNTHQEDSLTNKEKIGLLSKAIHCTLLPRKVRTVRTTHFYN